MARVVTGGAGAEGFGESFGSILITVGTAGSGFAEGGAFSKVAYITRWDTPEGIAMIKTSGELKPGSFVQRGRGGPVGYVLSGVGQLRYPFTSKITLKVPKSSLTVPKPFYEIWKVVIGQRTIKVPVKIR